MASESKIIGIDLGTTNSVVAVVVGTDPEVIPNAEGANKTPSVVAFLDNNEVVVGEIARRQAATNAHRTISSVKRLMGRSFDDLEESGERFPFNVVDHDGEALIDIDGMGYRPEQISALVLRKLKESAEDYLGEEVSQAVITVPAYFDDLQRQATMDAAEMAGLKVLRLINEPTAAAMAYGIGRSENAADEIVAVYDFGGGTFDITLLEISGKTLEVLTSTGDTHLGGDDLDNAIVDVVREDFHEEHGVDLGEDPVTLRRLKEVAERAKCELSGTRQARLSLPFIAYKDGQPLHLDRAIDRDEFEDLIEPFVRRTIKCCKKALDDAQLNKKDLSKVIMVGGTTRIPLVQDSVEEFFDQAGFRGVNPDEVVALGAATQAGIFEGNVQEVILLDVTPHSLGIETEGGRFSKIIEKNASIPIKAAKTFTTTEENQEFVNIHVLQGESDDAAENRSLGKFSLTGISPGPAGVARIRVTFFINADGVMEISAEDMKQGRVEEMKIVHSELTSEEKKRRSRRRDRAKRGKRRGDAASPATGRRRRASSESSSGAPRGAGLEGRSLGGAPAPIPARPAGETAPSAESSAPIKGVPTPSPADTGQKEERSFAVLGDTRPGDTPPTSAVRSRPSRAPGGPVAIEPVDYSKNPPTYSDLPSSKARVPAEPPTPPRDVPKPPAAPAPNHGATVPELPAEVEEAVRLAEEGAETTQALHRYTRALEVLATPTFAGAETLKVQRARILLHSMAGQQEECRQALLRAVEVHGKPAGPDLLALYERALGRFGTPSFLRDRGLLKELVGDLAGACADIEQAARQEPTEADRDVLERLYRARSAGDDDPAAKFKLVKILLKKTTATSVDEAIEVLQDLRKHPSYEARALKILGLCHWQKDMHFLAWQKFKSLPVDDDMQDILYRLACDMEARDQLHNAIQVLERLLEFAPNYRDAEPRLRKLRYRVKLQADEVEQQREVPSLSKDSRFTIIEEINRGSMGIIYKATDKTLNEIVALKVLNDYLCSDPSAVERFKSEARAAKKLSHPYIVRIHDLFELDNKRFLSMEFIDGTDLKRLFSERTTFPEDRVLYYFRQICDALAYAHKLNIVHRDIKPANIMITSQDSVKITDFGIAKILRGEDATKSGTAVIGTPLYMAPEQILGDPVDGRTDIYALGIMLYEMMSGNPPFYLGNIEYHHIHTQPPPLPESVSPKLREVIMKMIAKDPADRFQQIGDIVPALTAP